MPTFQYLDLDLDIDRDAGAYHVRVTNSPAGNADGTFVMPFNEIELENFLLKLGGARRRMRRLESPAMDAAKQFGGRLFDAVFTGTVRDCLTGSLAQADAHNAGLRIRLHLDGSPELADLPWEFLYNPALNRFLSLSVNTPLVRYIDIPGRIRPLTVTPPLRVLAIIANATDYDPLDVEREWNHLDQALRQVQSDGSVILERLDVASLPALQKKLQTADYHILHFVGHGGFDEKAQDGVLVLEDGNGRGRQIGGQYLGTLLHDHPSMRLVVLNACEGARASRTDPFAGVAQSLVQQGVPAVIAMQFEISDDAAALFAGDFYQALVRGLPVDAALAEVRKTMYADESTVEWGTPVLYLRAPDGKIFDIQGTAPTAAPSPITPARPSPVVLPSRLGELARKPLTWAVALLLLILVGVGGYLLWNAVTTPRKLNNSEVQFGQFTTASKVIDGPVADTYLPVGRRTEFTPDDPDIYVVIEMMRLPKAARLELRLLQTGGFEKIYPSDALARDIRDETNAWWFFRLAPHELCAEPGVQCPGTFHAEILVNRQNAGMETIFSILPVAPTQTPNAACAPGVRLSGGMTVPANSILPAGSTRTQAWDVENSGACPWGGDGYTLVQVQGPTLAVTSFEIPQTGAHQETQIKLLFTVPSAPAKYETAWRIQDPNGRLFGDILNLSFAAQAGQTATPTTPLSVISPTAPPVTRSPGSGSPCAFPVPAWISASTNAQTLETLGCPVQDVIQVQGSEQPFESGRMVALRDFGVIYVIVSPNGVVGRWTRYPDTWKEGERESGNLGAPEGKLEPVRGFGKVWLGSLGGPKSSIGWATGLRSDEITWQDQLFQKGFVLETPASLYLFLNDQTWRALSK